MSSTNSRFATIALSALVLTACDTEPEDWQAAEAAGSVESYSAYLDAHPSGEHAEEARTLLDALLEGTAWDEARASNTEDAYSQYLETHSDGAHAQEARVRRAGLGFNSVQVSLAIDTPEGTYFMSPMFGAIESYPEGTELNLRLDTNPGGVTGTVATVDAIYERIEEGNGRFVSEDGTCLWLGPTASTVSPCPDYEVSLPDPDDAEAVLLYTWMSDFN